MKDKIDLHEWSKQHPNKLLKEYTDLVQKKTILLKQSWIRCY